MPLTKALQAAQGSVTDAGDPQDSCGESLLRILFPSMLCCGVLGHWVDHIPSFQGSQMLDIPGMACMPSCPHIGCLAKSTSVLVDHP